LVIIVWSRITIVAGFVDWVCELLDHLEIHIRHGNLFLPPVRVVKCNICGKLRKRKFDSECEVFDRKEVWVSLLVTDGILKEYNIRRHHE